MKTRSLSALCSGLILIALASCANLEAVREFAAVSATAAGFDGVVDDYVAQPDRIYAYTASEDDQKEAMARSEQRPQLEALYTVLEEYMSALGEVAADDLSTYDKDLKALGDAVKKGGYFKDAEVDVFVKATGSLASALTDYYRARELHELIKASDTAIGDLISMMHTLNQAFALSNDIEKSKVLSFYGSMLQDPNDSIQKLARMRKTEDLRQIEQRSSRIAKHDQVLSKIRSGHAALAASQDITDTAFLKSIFERARAIYRDMKAVYDLK